MRYRSSSFACRLFGLCLLLAPVFPVPLDAAPQEAAGAAGKQRPPSAVQFRLVEIGGDKPPMAYGGETQRDIEALLRKYVDLTVRRKFDDAAKLLDEEPQTESGSAFRTPTAPLAADQAWQERLRSAVLPALAKTIIPYRLLRRQVEQITLELDPQGEDPLALSLVRQGIFFSRWKIDAPDLSPTRFRARTDHALSDLRQAGTSLDEQTLLGAVKSLFEVVSSARIG